MNFFTADEHYGHANVIRFCKRPFTDVNDMTERLIENHNAVVRKGDCVYHCGDMFWRTVSIPEANRIMDRLNGKHYLLVGNHDEVAKAIAGRFEWVRECALIHAPTRVWCSHYAHRSWPDSHKFSYHVYGHTHNELSDYRYSTDVGVDTKGYAPFSYDQLTAYMAAKGQFKPDEVQIAMYKQEKI